MTVHTAGTPRAPRTPHAAERHLDLEHLRQLFAAGAPAVRDGTQQARDELADAVAHDVVKAKAAGLPCPDGLPVDETAMLARVVEIVLADFYRQARRTVADELQRQADEHTPPPGAPLSLAKPNRPFNPQPRRPQVLAQTADVLAATIATDATAAAVIAYETAARGGATVYASDLAPAALKASDASALRVGMAVHQIIGQGRHDEAVAQRDVITSAVCSAVLDDNTCGPCEAMDGTETTNLDEAESWTPVGDCEGGDRCRCVTFFIFGEG